MDKNSYINTFKNSVQSQTIDFLSFLVSERILTISIGLVVGSQIYSLINLFTNKIVSPILNRLFRTKEERLTDFNVKIFGITFELGKILAGLLNLLIVVYILYLLFKLEKKIATSYINNK